ncbi:sigma-54-dependent Fis family transcriptional regulator [Sulfuriferula plumbiphila]|uniref:Sigma-54-dependent Fis family transcriptional regulator n=1 Tax=Sulfuriferula plumbiphila TaxID=171865 RepID=A0A512L4M1_9PROT|nr:sigma-54 dependent transcriptional regulator [Sulfuriferula plumbiphila]BBP05562.1 sigma-54-dependent Fis family transcriptional regulator [Sulfuriferula plumbiphila]GEP29141.1 sigma-54-dependent Fis family transcriptional regulator [Sulfuriferula plumbiphila]
MSLQGISAKPSLLIVDDDPLITDTLNFVLSRDFEVFVADSRSQVKSLLTQLDTPPQLALVDLGLPPLPHKPDEGFHLISELLGYSPGIKILVLSGQNDETNARHARALGAIDFVGKPCEPAQIKSLLFNALLIQDVERSAETEAPAAENLIVGTSFNLDRLRQQITQYANAPFPVLIEGESGSGKELVAASLHKLSGRTKKPYLALNCAAISPTLVEPTLFGYCKGAFTGATSNRAGYFEDACDGTLFLDEIGELPLELQAKLLRVLENGEFQRVGETQSRFSNARVVTATNRDLRQEIKAGRFRADLYHRLSVFGIAVPPLRELGEDKVRLLEHFREFYAREARVKPFALDNRARQMWEDYHFPGNVRELRNIVIRLTTKCAGQNVTAEQLETELDTDTAFPSEIPLPNDGKALYDTARRHLQTLANFSLDQTMKQWEKSYVEAALNLTHGNLSQAAKILGINRTTLYSRMQTYTNEA